MITSFKEEHDFLSNFAPVSVLFEGELYPSVEHAYIAAKTTDKEIRKQVQKLEHAGKAKRFGRKIPIRDDWEQVRLSVMERLLEDKFTQSPYREWLKATGSQELIEGNTWGDTFWGCTFGGEDFIGENHLGKLLMKIRKNLCQDRL